MSTPKLTPQLEEKILVWVRSGAYPNVAAAAEGVSLDVFERWRVWGTRKSPRPIKRYQQFAANLLSAAGFARVRAEIKVLEKDPKGWLLCGPGRERPDRPGWSTAVKAAAAEQDGGNLWTNPVLAGQIERVLAALVPFPEARKAVVEALQKPASEQ
jgi:hypothetical protein